MRLPGIALSAVVTVGVAPAPASAHALHSRAERDNVVVVENLDDDSYRHRGSVQVAVVRAADLTATNVAVAYARCERCRTITVALQVVVAGASHRHWVGDQTPERPRDIVVVNRAVAVNDSCVDCDSLALAYQFVVVDDRRVRITWDGRRELRDVRRDLRRLLRRGPPTDVVAAEVGALVTRVQTVLAEELVRRPQRVRERHDDDRVAGSGHRARRDLAAGDHESARG